MRTCAHAMYARTEGNRAAHVLMHCRLGGQKGPCPTIQGNFFFRALPRALPRGHRSGAEYPPSFQSGGWSNGNTRLLLAKSLPSPRTAEEAIALRDAHLAMALGGSGPNRHLIEEEQLLPDALFSSLVLPLTTAPLCLDASASSSHHPPSRSPPRLSVHMKNSSGCAAC